MGTITGSNNNDVIVGTSGSDTINSGNGDDTVNGGAGSDSINGGAGNDILDGGSGSDQLNGGSGDDTLIYNVLENAAAGTKDVYTGGAGIDTVVLQLSSAQWLDKSVRAELQRYVELLATVKTNPQGEVSNGSASDFMFTFGSSTLTVQMMEKLVVAVQQTAEGPYNAVNYLAALISGSDAGSAVEAGGTNNANIGTPTVSGDLYADDLDGADDVFQAVAAGASANYGTYSVGTNGVWTYALNNSHESVQALAVGESLSDSFTVRSADGTSKLVKISIVGSNDAPVVSAALTTGAAEGNGSYSRNLLAGSSDADHGETATLSVADVRFSVNGAAASNGPPAGVSLVGNTLTIDPTSAAFNHLAAGQHATIVVAYNIKDVHGATVAQTETITINGTNDVPVVSGSLTARVSEDGPQVTLDALANASDVDDGTTLSVVGLPATLPAGVSYSAAMHSFVTNPGNAAFQGLAAGQSATVNVDYGVSDGLSTTATSASFTITGTNDVVSITSGAQSGSVIEDAAPQQASGVISFNDADLIDVHAASFVPHAGALGVFTLAPVSESASTENGQVGWTYTIDNGAANHLAAGESVTETYTVKVDDQHGSFTTQDVVITITGTNDVVSITGGAQSGSVVEDAAPQQASGMISFNDVDLIDVHAASFVPHAGALGVFTLAPVSESASTENGQVGWTYTIDNGAANHLAAGESVTETYTVKVDDQHGSFTTQDVKITITGTNDVVSITSGGQSGLVVEDGAPQQASGMISFNDIDLIDVHTASFAPHAGALGVFSLTPVLESASTENGQVGWAYNINNGAANHLAAGESVTETYTVKVDDQHGSFKTQDVTITITGTNDVVSITSGAQSGSVVEDAAPQQASGMISFNDADLIDVHTASFQPHAGALGVFALAPVSESASTENGQVGWTYTVDNGAANHLAAGESVTETYTVKVDDQHGSFTTQDVVITITGTNDVVSITSGVQSGSVVEDAAPQQASGVISFNDADLIDVHAASFVPHAGALGVFALAPVSESASTEGAQVGWTYTVDHGAANHLAAGESVTETYTVKVDDQHGSFTTQDVVITITGTNDVVSITSGAQSGSVAEDAVPQQANGMISFNDADLIDVHAASFVPHAGALGVFALAPVSESASTENGQVGWTYTVDNGAANHLAAGESVSETYTVKVDDQHGSFTTQDVVITITGTNDVVTITSGAQSGSAVEDGAPQKASGTISFNDVDLIDVHMATFEPHASALGVFALAPVAESASTENGQVGWTYTVDNGAADHLAAGESVTETYTVKVDDQHGSFTTQDVVITITGTNDVVSITSGAQSGSVAEDAVPQQANGMISFNDADLIDVHAASFVPHAGALGVFALAPVSESASTENGQVGWTYTVDNGAANHLAAGESVSETYTVKVDDQHGSFTTQDVVITITGTNDVVSITSGAQAGSVTEDAAPQQASGMISFNDADLIDVHAASFDPHAGALGVFSLAPVSESTATEGGQVGWTYTVDNGAANHLAAGESVTETYTVKVDDQHGSFTTQDVVITITGTNDVVTITSGGQSGSVVEDAAPQQASGMISFNDVDLIDVHAASFVPHAGALGVFSLAPVAESASTEGGQVGWTYTVNNGAANHLAAGESVTETYTVKVDDQHGSFTTQDVVITITGTNDVVSITSGAQSGSVVEDAAPQQANGMISFNDADLIDVHTASFQPHAGALGVFALAPVSESASTENGQVGWTYTVDNGAANHLAAGESVTENYTVKVDDQHGSFTTQDVTITITGTNDVVSITSGAQSGSVVEDVAPQQANGTISFNDVDLMDVHAASFVPHAGALGVFALAPVSESASTENGQVGWTYTIDNDAANHLAAGESVTETYTVKVDDQHGSFTTQDVTITITGTNDVVSITSGAQSGSVVEDVAPQQANGTISFNDVDLMDVHAASFVPHAGALGVFALAPVSESASTENGQVGWTYTIDNDAANHLAAGESVTETYTVKVDDQHGSFTTQDVVITITGTNDVVSITSGAQSGSVVEDAAPQQASGTISFNDVDLIDVHAASFVAHAGALGVFTLAPVSESASTENGQVGWTYTIDNGAANHLASGESVTETYTVKVDDQHGSFTTQDVVITITGTNDVVSITGGAQSGSVVEDAAPQQANGMISFNDADLIDVHMASFEPHAGALGVFALAAVAESASTENGQVGWTYTVDNGAANHLAAGESVTETYTVKVDDQHGSFTTQDVVITITGTNDVVSITSGPQAGSVTEDAAPQQASGMISFNDADLIDVHAASFVPHAGALGVFALAPVAESAATEGGQVGWTYTVDNGAANHLAAGESVTEIYTVKVDDQHGSFTSQDVTITITGTNDVVSITSGAQSGSVVEDVAPQQENGTISFNDVDLIDIHAASFVPHSGALGVFALAPVSESPSTENGQVGWTYNVDNGAANHLAAGESVTETYTVKVDDQHGSFTTQDVVITITGTNDVVSITSGAQAGSVTEDAAPQQASGMISFNDADLIDVHAASFAPHAGALGVFALTPVSESASTEGAHVGWTYTVDNNVANHLAAGESVTETYTVKVDDQHGSFTTQDIVITITGTNDVVSIIGGAQSGSVVEDAAPLQANGMISFNDADLIDVHTASFQPHAGALGVFALAPVSESASTENGQVGWTYTVDNGAANHLAAGESVSETYTVKVDDLHGSFTTQDVVITISGTNDVVSITSGAQSGSVAEDAVPQQASGTISFNDADLIDVHAASFDPHAGALGVFSLAPVAESAATEGGQVGWTYTVDNGAANHLAAGESVTETYTVRVDDQHGSFTTQDVVITISGTNDVVSITSGAQTGSVVEDAAPQQAGGMISFNDADLIDVHMATFEPNVDALGVFALAPVSESASTEDGELGWTYTVDNGAANHLAAGESITETYTVKVDDQHGSFTTQDVVITITGTNDVVSITSGAQSGSVVEDAAPQQANGTISFNDADLIDVHAASFAPHAGALGVFALVSVSESASTENGQVGWTYTVDNGAANHLAAGESVTETYTVKVDDLHGSFTTQDVVITITGTNDVVRITSGAQSGSVVEDAAPQQANGVISFNDVDLIDVHAASFAPYAGALGVFALVSVSESASTENGQVGWTYTVDNGAADHLAAGESVTETYTVKVDDQHGSFTTQEVVITIAGTNDVVSITSGAQSGSVVEDAAAQQASGMISFNDADLVDVHTASFQPHAGALGVFALAPVSESASTENGQVGWTYTVDNGAANHLAAGESVTETYTVKVDDQHGSFTTQDVVITISGTNDVVSITSGAQSGSVVEDAAPQQANGMISFNDVDLIDIHAASFVPHAGALGVFALAPVSESASTENGQVGWTYTVNNSAANHLAAGESVTETYTVKVDDQHGSFTTQDVVITITGTNDVVSITSGGQSGSVVEDAAPQQANGIISFNDADLIDVHMASFVPHAGALGVFALAAVAESASTENGQVGWTYTVNNAAANHLAAGESVTETYTVKVDDLHGSFTTQDVMITIAGTNDVVSITSGGQSGSVVEDSAPQQANGTISFNDADLIDVHAVSFLPHAGALGVFSLAPVAESASTEGGQVGWTYTVDNAAANRLAAGDSVTENYTVKVDDQHGSFTTQDVVITITGTNDVVSITSGAQSGSVVEDAAPQQANGTISFNDVDLIDVHTASFQPHAGALGVFALAPVSESASTENGQVGWTYTVDNGAANHLAAGESVTETYTVKVDDLHGSFTTQDVVITITGTNDVVSITSGGQSGSVVEDAAPQQANGTISFNDADLIDVHAASFVPHVGALGVFALAPVSESASTENGQVGWTYTVNNAAANRLATGESVTETYTVKVDDQHGSFTTQDVAITITGTNDVVSITSGAQAGSVVENGAPQPASGTISFNDADLIDVHTASFVPHAGALGALALNAVSESASTASGQVGWTYTVDNIAANHLAAGETVTEIYTVKVDDQHGSFATQDVSITISGTNDAVSITSGAQSGSVTEDGVQQQAAGTISFNDADLIDVHTASFVPHAGALGVFSLGSVSESAATESGQLGWTYTVNNAAANFLAAGQTVTETYTVTVDDQHGSTTSQDVVITITGTNDAPVLNAAASPVLTSVAEDAGTPFGAVGTLVSSLVNLNPPVGGLDNVSDADSGALTGIAMTDANTANGTWWYSTNGGVNWSAVGSVTNSSALLLAADSSTRVYFQGEADFNGVVANAITFRAWDGTSGTAGTKASTAINGGTSAFSSATDSTSILVTAVNDNPIAIADRIIVSNGTLITISTSALLGNDTDIDGYSLDITSVSSASGITGLQLDTAAGTISFTSGDTAGASAGSFSYTVSDGAGGTATATVTIDIRTVGTGNGADTIDLSSAGAYQVSYIDGRGGADTLTGGAGGDVFIGGTGNAADTLTGSAGNDLLVGGDGNDTLSGGAGNDVLRGGMGSNDAMDGGAGSEDMLDFSDATSGISFTLVQSASSTNIANGTGGLGNNDNYKNIEGVIGTAFADTINGSSGNDILRGGTGNDTLDGKGGNDLLDFSDGAAGITFTLVNNGSGTVFATGAANLGTDTYSGFEGVIGTAYADTLTGSASADQLRGGGGNDAINGLAGDDRIVGGTGADILTGGADNDTFVFDTAPNAVDSITDFNASGSVASGDTIELSAAVFTALASTAGNTLAASEFAALDGGAASDVVGGAVRVIYDSATGNLYYDSDGLGAANRTLMAHLALENPADTFDQNDIKVGL